MGIWKCDYILQSSLPLQSQIKIFQEKSYVEDKAVEECYHLESSSSDPET